MTLRELAKRRCGVPLPLVLLLAVAAAVCFMFSVLVLVNVPYTVNLWFMPLGLLVMGGLNQLPTWPALLGALAVMIFMLIIPENEEAGLVLGLSAYVVATWTPAAVCAIPGLIRSARR